MRKKFTFLTAIAVTVYSIVSGQSAGKTFSEANLPSIFKELENGPPSRELLQTNPTLFQHLMKRRIVLQGMLQKEVQEGRLPKSSLAILKEQQAETPVAKPSSTDKAATTNFQFVKDINTATDASPSNYNYTFTSSFAVLNKIIYYTADDGINGQELWRSNGTDTGTYLVKNIAPGSASANALNITTFNGKIYFEANDGINGWELYQSDGTSAGTKLFKDIVPGSGSSYPSRFTIVNGSLYFVTQGNTNYNTQYSQLWKSDGTAANTTMVIDIYTNFSSGNIGQLTAVNSLLFFTGYSTVNGRELWRSDGTMAGTYLIKDINPYNNNYYYDDGNGPANLTFYNNKLYFSASDASFLRTIWVSDGTYAGTTAAPYNNGVALGNTYYASYQDQPFAIAKNALFFAGTVYATGTELYKYDASNIAGAVLVKDISASTVSSYLQNEGIRSMNDTIYFVTLDFTGTIYNLWKSAGTAASTTIVKALPAYSYSFYAIGKNLYFNSRTDATGYEPWISDGTAAGTKLLKDINAGSFSSSPYEFTLCNGKIYLTATTAANGRELWSTLGTSASTNLVKDINTTTTGSGVLSYNYHSFAVIDTTRIVFDGITPTTGTEVWRSNGTAAGTQLTKDLIPGENGSYPQFYASKNGKAYFLSYDYNTGQQNLLQTDGSNAGAKIIAATAGYIYDLKVADNGTVFYITYNSSYELWRTDSIGTNYRINRNADYNFGVAGNLCFFSAASPYGKELWKSDGTLKGTNLIADINPGAGDSYPSGFQALGNKVIFQAYNGVGYYLWASDGTTTGTILLKTIQPNTYSGACVSNNKLYFSAAESVNGSELYSSDGSPAGTILIKDIYTGTNGSFPNNFTAVNGTVYFLADDGVNGSELWKTTGTLLSTKLVKDITPGATSSYLGNFTSAGGKLYFTDSSLLWVSDGTTLGTKKVADPNLTNVTSIGFLCGTGKKLFISGYSYAYGNELYEGDATLPAIAPMVKSQDAIKIKQGSMNASVAPNPAHNIATIQVDEALGEVKVLLTDMNGRILWQTYSISQNIFTINISHLAQGTYMVLVKDEKETKVIKLIKE